MPLTITTDSSHVLIGQKVEVQTALLGKCQGVEIYAVRQTIETTRIVTIKGEAKQSVQTTVCNGLADTKGVIRAMEGWPIEAPRTKHPEFDTDLRNLRSQQGIILALPPEFLEELQQDQNTSIGQHQIKDPLKVIEEGGTVIPVDYFSPSNLEFDLDGVPYPQQHRFGYITGSFANDNYDLDKAVEILSKRSDVALLPFGGDKYAAKKKPVEYIVGIPSYNASDTRHSYIAFDWFPSREDYAKAYKPNQPIHIGIYENDLLGLHAGGAVRDWQKGK